MAIKVVLAKAHKAQLEDEEIKKERCSIEDELNKVNLTFQKGTINLVFIKGIYFHNERKMVTVCLFVNATDKPITELHGILRLKFNDRKAQIAKTTINFDKPFIGTLNTNEALLVHIGIPVRALSNDERFTASDISGSFEDVRVTFGGEENGD